MKFLPNYPGSCNHISHVSHFSASSFTIAAFDNFDNTDRNSLSGTKHAYDTAITIFQVKPQNPIVNQKRALLNWKVSRNLKSSNVKNFAFFDAKCQKLPLPDSFEVPPGLANSEKNITEHNQKQFIMSCAQIITNIDFNDLIPSWARIIDFSIRFSNYASQIFAISSKACHWLFNCVHCNVKHIKDCKSKWSKETPSIFWLRCVLSSNRHLSFKYQTSSKS